MTRETDIKRVFCKVMGVDESSVTDGTAYNSLEAWDSFRHLQLVAELEETFNIELGMDDIIAMENFGKVKQILAKYLKSDGNDK
jgi:acyl carrier protein